MTLLEHASKWLVGILTLLWSPMSQALPIGFGKVAGDLEYYELRNKHFYIYHDKRTPHEAALVLNSFEHARPILEKWFSEKRDSPLPVITSAVSSNASFANFITDAVELQTLGQANRDLVWHEYVHSTMYLHFENWLGPAGSIIHLMWLPSWFVEGLAEALSFSIGSNQTAMIERYHALSGNWPSYDRLHSLYSNSDFSFRGYATSGAFVSFLLRQLKPDQLPTLLHHYFHKSMPWYWPYSLIPLQTSLPLDNVLDHLLDKNGEQLYEEYKAQATRYWKNYPSRLLTNEPRPPADFGMTHTMRVLGKDAYKLKSQDNRLYWSRLNFKGPWANSSSALADVPDELASTAIIFNPDLKAFVFVDKDMQGNKTYYIKIKNAKNKEPQLYTKRSARPKALFETRKHIVWLEHETEHTRVCLAPKSFALRSKELPKQRIRCPFKATLPKTLSIIGTKNVPDKTGNLITREVWIKEREQTLKGDRFRVVRWLVDQRKFDRFQMSHGGEPIEVAFAGQSSWMLTAEKNARTLRKIDAKGRCLGVIKPADLILQIRGYSSGMLLASLFSGDQIAVRKIRPREFKLHDCYVAGEHSSPLLYAMNKENTPSLYEAVRESSPWTQEDQARIRTEQRKRDNAAPLDQATAPTQDHTAESQPAKWRLRPVFAVPWLGADSGGTQLGLLSVPLMDHMQNEDIRMYLAYGPESRFPHYQVSLNSTRFWPDYALDVFRYQTWNGLYTDKNDNDQSGYVDERGVRLTSHIYFHDSEITTDVGVKYSKLIRYIGPARTGNLAEPFISASRVSKFGPYRWSKSLNFRLAPESLNEEFDYNVIGLATGLARNFDFLDSSLTLSLSGSRTRGKKRRNLQEFYRPLKTFVPGSRSGYNDLSFPFYGCCGLFSARYGDNQGRARLSYLFPLIKNVDYLIRIFYWESLYLSADYNYGGAWYGDLVPEDKDLVGSHNYNATMNFDVKGVNFTAGGGVGQVFGSPMQVFLTFSFDAIL